MSSHAYSRDARHTLAHSTVDESECPKSSQSASLAWSVQSHGHGAARRCLLKRRRPSYTTQATPPCHSAARRAVSRIARPTPGKSELWSRSQFPADRLGQTGKSRGLGWTRSDSIARMSLTGGKRHSHTQLMTQW
jgi:hypothetical protein